MRFLSLLVVSTLTLSVFASPFDPPARVSAEEKASWTQARCKWRMVETPEMIGYETDLHVKSMTDCFMEARVVMIMAATDTEYSLPDRARYMKSWDVIWDNHQGQQSICQMIPLKADYPVIDESLAKAALADNDQAAIAQLKQIVDANIAVECNTPTQ